MARRRRPGSRTSVVDGRAQLIIPIEIIDTADGEPMRFTGMKTWMPRVKSYPAALDAARSASLVIDGFSYDFHLGDLGHSTDTHDGNEFLDAIRANGGVEVYIVDGVDPRRSQAEDLDAAAREGRLVGGRVLAFEVDQLSE